MNNIHKRFLLFLFGCIGSRSALVILIKNQKKNNLPIFGYIGLIVSFGFLYIYLTNSRKTGGEVFGDKIWWNELRVVHGLLYLCFSIYSIKKKNYSWIPLLIDVSIGLISFLFYHYKNNNFIKLKI